MALLRTIPNTHKINKNIKTLHRNMFWYEEEKNESFNVENHQRQ